jgi:murein DD-endopeptidase MepM/ murein hydrolase activator NlpD
VHGRRAGATAVVLASLVAVGIPTAGAADDPNDRKRAVDAQVKSLDAEVDRSAVRVAKASAALERAAAELPKARANLGAAQAEVREAEAEVAAAAERRRQTRADLLHNARSQDRVEGDVLARRAAVAALTRTAYTGGDFARLGVLVGARSPEQLTSSLAYLQAVNRAQRDALDGLAVAERALEARRGELADLQRRDDDDRAAAEAAVVRAGGAVATAAGAQAAVAEIVAARTDALAEARELKATVEKRLAEQEAESRRLAAIIAARIAAAKRAAAAAAARGKTLPRTLGGLLSLPAVGPITSGYGMRYHPILRRTKLHTGTDFGVPTGTSVRAAADGEVLQVLYSGAYGRRIVVDHGRVGGAYLVTTYNHLNRFAVRPGQKVTRGQILGYSGSTGWSTGPHLHFEVLANGRFVDPMTVLRPRR